MSKRGHQTEIVLIRRCVADKTRMRSAIERLAEIWGLDQDDVGSADQIRAATQTAVTRRSDASPEREAPADHQH
jgi:hypothetical protein